MKSISSKKIIMGGALAIILALAGIIGFAQQGQQGQNGPERHGRDGWQGRGDGPGGGFEGRIFENLNLTDAQKQQIQQITARYHESLKAKRQQERGQAGKREGYDPFSGAAFDEAAVRAAAQARANEMVEMEVTRAHMMYEIYNVLTPEQKAQLAQQRQQREQKRQEFRSRRPSNSGTNQ
ncbi:MAG TPA: Spy/CpxP family protein refolding chaperone [Pyrinomonadaceae bacterium]|nr:Spy/CpxP family protein refolding chaperone [Pyrinomonadaceae bacterium]